MMEPINYWLSWIHFYFNSLIKERYTMLAIIHSRHKAVHFLKLLINLSNQNYIWSPAGSTSLILLHSKVFTEKRAQNYFFSKQWFLLSVTSLISVCSCFDLSDQYLHLINAHADSGVTGLSLIVTFHSILSVSVG